MDYDETLHCSEARDVGVGALQIDLSEIAGQARGQVSITLEPLVATQPAAHLRLGGQLFDGGVIDITDVDGTIDARFTATVLAQDLTVTGSVNATICD